MKSQYAIYERLFGLSLGWGKTRNFKNKQLSLVLTATLSKQMNLALSNTEMLAVYFELDGFGEPVRGYRSNRFMNLHLNKDNTTFGTELLL